MVSIVWLLGHQQGIDDTQDLGCTGYQGDFLMFALLLFLGDEFGDHGMVLHGGHRQGEKDGSQMCVATVTDSTTDDTIP